MAKFFVVSDIHSFFDEFKQAIDDAGFDPNNENHWLISCGDALDRGPKTQEVLDYLMNLDRCILIKGNHDQLIMDCINRGFALYHDHHNGTHRSIIDLAPNAATFEEACTEAYVKVKPFIDNMVNYFETKQFIFCHSFIALKYNDYDEDFSIYDPDWRNAHNSAWKNAMWGNPYKLAEKGLLPDKTLVFGHYHTSWPRHEYNGEPEFGEGSDFSIYYGNGYIALDACCAYSHKINCLVLEDDFLEGDKND